MGSIPGWGRTPGLGNSNLTPIFSPGECHGQRSLAGYSPWGCKESDTTEHAHTGTRARPRKHLTSAGRSHELLVRTELTRGFWESEAENLSSALLHPLLQDLLLLTLESCRGCSKLLLLRGGALRGQLRVWQSDGWNHNYEDQEHKSWAQKAMRASCPYFCPWMWLHQFTLVSTLGKSEKLSGGWQITWTLPKRN